MDFSERLLWFTFLQGTPFFNGKLILHDPPGLANGARGVMRPFNPGNILGGNSTNGPGGFMITSPPSKFGAIPKKMPSPAAQVGFSFLSFLHTSNSFTYLGQIVKLFSLVEFKGYSWCCKTRDLMIRYLAVWILLDIKTIFAILKVS